MMDLKEIDYKHRRWLEMVGVGSLGSAIRQLLNSKEGLSI